VSKKVSSTAFQQLIKKTKNQNVNRTPPRPIHKTLTNL